jgi:KUP system potassium uptake protein
MALATATQEAIFLIQLLNDMDELNDYGSVLLCGDNQGALALSKNPVSHQRSKHIDVKYHFIRTEVKNGRVRLMYVPSQENVADIFTKPVGKIKFKVFAEILFGSLNSD